MGEVPGLAGVDRAGVHVVLVLPAEVRQVLHVPLAVRLHRVARVAPVVPHRRILAEAVTVGEDAGRGRQHRDVEHDVPVGIHDDGVVLAVAAGAAVGVVVPVEVDALGLVDVPRLVAGVAAGRLGADHLAATGQEHERDVAHVRLQCRDALTAGFRLMNSSELI